MGCLMRFRTADSGRGSASGTSGAKAPLDSRPESECRRCGGPNRVWYAPSPLWNAVMRLGGSINGAEDFSGIICPTCFVVLAEERGIASMWRLDAREVHIELELTTPSGRTWSAATDRWVDPSEPGDRE